MDGERFREHDEIAAARSVTREREHDALAEDQGKRNPY